MADVTGLLLQWNEGDQSARATLIEHIYAELNTIAARHLAYERHSVELQPNSLVHEAYLRLIDLNRVQWQNRAHFMAMSARIMREILVDKARQRNAAKRSGGRQVTLTGLPLADDDTPTDALMIHAALEQLAEVDPDRARLVELRFFGGLTIDETAEVMGSSPATVKRSWEVARGWLYRAIREGAAR